MYFSNSTKIQNGNRAFDGGEKPECDLPDNMPLPTVETRKRSRFSVAQRRSTIVPKEPQKVTTRSDDEDNEPPSDDEKDSSSRSSVESETSDTSLTNFRIQQKNREEAASSSKRP